VYKTIVPDKSVRKWGSQFSVCRGINLANVNKQFLIKKVLKFCFWQLQNVK